MSDAASEDFEPLNMVERQLIAAARGNEEQQLAFERFILDETLYVATPEARPEGATDLAPGSKLNLLNVTLNDGRAATAVFTAPQRAAGTFGDVGYIAMPGRKLFEMIRHVPAMLNPGHSYGVVWEPQNLSRMLGLPHEHVVKKDTQFMLGSPAEPPLDLIERLKTSFEMLPEVDAAWLALAAWPDRPDQSWYLDVRTAATDHEPIRRAMQHIVDGADMHGRVLDMSIKPRGGANGVGIPIKEPSRKGFFKRLFG